MLATNNGEQRLMKMMTRFAILDTKERNPDVRKEKHIMGNTDDVVSSSEAI